MRLIIYAIIFIALLLFIGSVVYMTQNGWWSLLLLTIPIIINSPNKELKKESKENINEDYN